jgi:hypothetical protein
MIMIRELTDLEESHLIAGICPHCLSHRIKQGDLCRQLCLACHHEYAIHRGGSQLIYTQCPPDRLLAIYGLCPPPRRTKTRFV